MIDEHGPSAHGSIGIETAAERLRRVIAGRTVGILLHGPSVETMRERVTEFADLDLSYTSLNLFRVMEEDVLSQIAKDLDFVMCSSEEELPRRLHDIEEFLSRSPDKTLITSRLALEGIGYLLERHRHQIIFTTTPNVPREELPNSVTILIQTLVRLNATPRIILFGADGMVVNHESPIETYFGKETLRKENRDCCLVKDTRVFNTQFQPQLDAIYSDSGVARVEFLNCNPDTHLTPLPIISYDQLRECAEAPLSDWKPTPLSRAWSEKHEAALDRFLADPFSSQPRHMRNRCDGFQVVLHARTFYAFAPYLGKVDFAVLTPTDLADYLLTKACFMSDTMDGLRDGLSGRDPAKRHEGAARGKASVQHEGSVSVEFNESPIVTDEDYAGYVLFAHQDRFYAVTHDLIGEGLGDITGPQLDRHLAERRVFICDALGTLKEYVDGVGSQSGETHEPPAEPPPNAVLTTGASAEVASGDAPSIVEADHNGFLIFGHAGRVYGLAAELRGQNLSEWTDDDVSAARKRGLFFEADTDDAVRAAIDAFPGPDAATDSACEKALVLCCGSPADVALCIADLGDRPLALLVPPEMDGLWPDVRTIVHRDASGRPSEHFDCVDIHANELAALKAARFDTVYIAYGKRMTWRTGRLPERLAGAIAQRVVLRFSDGTERIYEGAEDMNRIGYNRAYLDNMLRHVPSLEGRAVLEVGCSDGLACDLMAIEGAARVVGIDVCEHPGSRFKDPRIECHRMAADRIEFADNTFDVTFSIAVLEHCPNPHKAIEEMHRVTKPGGLIFVQTAPLYHSPYGHHMFGYFDDLPWIHLRMSAEEIIELARERGLEERIRADRGQDVETFIRGMLSREHVNGRTLAEYGLAEFVKTHKVNVVHFARSLEGQDLLTDEILADIADVAPDDLVTHGVEAVFTKGRCAAQEAPQPPRLLGACDGYNLVEYADRVFAVPIALGHVDVTKEADRDMPGIIAGDRQTIVEALSA